MNELIEGLAKQSTIRFVCHECGESPFNYKKFAELIVRECARIAEEADDTFTGQGSTSAQAFKQHFGVEE